MKGEMKRIQTRHPDAAKSMPRIDRDVYDAFRTAILAATPTEGGGVAFRDLPRLVEGHEGGGVAFRDLPRLVEGQLPAGILERIGSVTWYVTTVKLDLEARGEIERVSGSRPQRLRRR
jgi:hypothetical protein